MNFSPSDLLTPDEITILIECDYANEKAETVCNKLSKYCFIIGDNLYVKDMNNNTYTKSKIDNKTIHHNVVLFVEKSFKAMDETRRDLIKLKYKTKYGAILVNAFAEKIYPQIVNYLEKKNIAFDTYTNEIHFENGYIDLKTGTFKQRDDSHYISKFIHRKYVPSSAEERKIIKDVIKQIYPEKEDMDYVLSNVGSALTGNCKKDQESLAMIGNGSSGKSTLMKLTEVAIEKDTYFKYLPSDTFNKGNQNTNKYMNSYLGEPQLRITHINEPDDVKMDCELYKNFIDGLLTSSQLYKDGTRTFEQNTKSFTSMNHLLNIKWDTGVSRRMKIIEHRSKFTDNEAEVNSAMFTYKRDRDLFDKLETGNLPNAIVDILVEYSKRWNAGEIPKVPANVKDTVEEMASSLDHTQKFIDENLIITYDTKDKITTDMMMERWHKVNPKLPRSDAQLKGDLKERIRHPTDPT